MKEKELNHLAIILDGNGRWAKKRNLPRSMGHKEGSENVVDIALYAKEKGIKYLTLYAFSTENWKRPQVEVNYLMKLLAKFIKDKTKLLMENEVKLNIIGDKKKRLKVYDLFHLGYGNAKTLFKRLNMVGISREMIEKELENEGYSD